VGGIERIGEGAPMATFTCYAPTNTFGNGRPPPFNLTAGDGFFFELDSQKFYQLFGGSFGYYANGTPYGDVDNIGVYNNNGALTRNWISEPGSYYDAAVIFDLLDTGTWRQYFKYIFYLNDQIYGSTGRDKINGHNGNDFIDGNRGNDKLKGGQGFDSFYFALFDGRDTILGFSRFYDTIVLDDSLASNFGDFSAYSYRRGTVLDFGSDEIKIKGLALSQLDQVNFDFVA
jgi:Ca2+-binding RTX toxin-like protein